MKRLELIKQAYDLIVAKTPPDDTPRGIYYFEDEPIDYCFTCAEAISHDWQKETMPERDCIVACNECGTPLTTSVLWSSFSEAKWLIKQTTLDIEKVSDIEYKDTRFILLTILDKNNGAFEVEPALTMRLARKVIKILTELK